MRFDAEAVRGARKEILPIRVVRFHIVYWIAFDALPFLINYLPFMLVLLLQLQNINNCRNLVIIAMFYGLPAVQLVMVWQNTVSLSGNMDLCYYNFRCARPFYQFFAFNAVLRFDERSRKILSHSIILQ